jgi:hypothetical protein
LEHHVGAPDSDMSEVCLEVAREGPRTEEEIFTKDRQRPGVLLFTDWSRRCAQLWRGLHGRRFACYKERVDKGKRHTGLRWHGSMKAVARMQESATKALVKMAREDDVARAAEEGERPRPTVVGIERGKLMRRAQMREVAAPTKALLNFRKTTATRKDMKSKASTWAGFGKRPPHLRRKQGKCRGGNMVAIPKLESSAAVLKSRVARWGSSAGTVVPSKVRSRLAGLAFRARPTSLGHSLSVLRQEPSLAAANALGLHGVQQSLAMSHALGMSRSPWTPSKNCTHASWTPRLCRNGCRPLLLA